MRTTLTLEEDVAAHLQRMLRERDLGLKALVNLALREGLRALERQTPPNRVSLRSFDCGPCLVGDLISISDALAQAEGDWHS